MQIDKTINRILYVPFNEDYSVDKKVGNVNLDFLAAIDTNTIFGNLIDNAIEAVEK